ncbi:beta-mannosidase [Nocardiopsis sp. TSRI0078]|uniref:cellulase family glycosylhydrolase n=1 Tax=unclassified Nocardiopsis TaxID=2649073 RepID=UPI00093FA744|nr:cellulase family glycosylhydrolase [Nocardiopsis sp. TSRI0078]OKI17398.1 beta-mannosidase [Nocardiopsis sp. TSRI0078]
MVKRLLIALGSVLTLVAALFAYMLPAHADTGFQVSDGRLVDAAGNDFVIRGVSHAHTWYTQETQSFADIKSLGANAVRVVLSSGDRWTENGVDDVANIVAECKANELICLLEVHDTTGYGEQAGAATLDQAVDYWLRVQDAVEGEEDHILVNIGNEPYGNDAATNQGWAGDTSAAINRLRDAGFDHTLVVDAPNWGQDWQGTMRDNARSVFDSDPHANTVFSIHMYGVYEQESTIVSYLEHFVDAGLPLIIGEFGHDHSDGDPDENAIMSHAERLGLGYVGWSWSGNGSPVEYLDMVEDFDADRLTPWGERIFNGPDGIASTAVEAPIYGGGGDPTDPPTEEPTDPPTEEPTDPPGGDCEADYRVTNEWSGGFQAEVTVTAGSDLTGWTVAWSFGGGESVSHAWNASVSSNGSSVTATDVGYNGALSAGQSTSFGFVGTHGGSVSTPALSCTA